MVTEELVDQFTLLQKSYVRLEELVIEMGANLPPSYSSQREVEQTSIDFTRGRFFSAISKPSTDFLHKPE